MNLASKATCPKQNASPLLATKRLHEDILKELITVRLTSIEEAYQLALRLVQQHGVLTMRKVSNNWTNPTPNYNLN